MITIGRVCIKLAGRDSGKHCVILSEAKNNKVLIDGETRRKEVNLLHLEPLETTLDLKANASHADVQTAFKKLNLTTRTTKPKKPAARPLTLRKSKLATPAQTPVKTTKKKKTATEQKV